jgi:hypothetical protein
MSFLLVTANIIRKIALARGGKCKSRRLLTSQRSLPHSSWCCRQPSMPVTGVGAMAAEMVDTPKTAARTAMSQYPAPTARTGGNTEFFE